MLKREKHQTNADDAGRACRRGKWNVAKHEQRQRPDVDEDSAANPEDVNRFDHRAT
jgi:hypothetical protein